MIYLLLLIQLFKEIIKLTLKDFFHGHQFAYFNIHPICFQLRIGTFGDLDPLEIHFIHS